MLVIRFTIFVGTYWNVVGKYWNVIVAKPNKKLTSYDPKACFKNLNFSSTFFINFNFHIVSN